MSFISLLGLVLVIALSSGKRKSETIDTVFRYVSGSSKLNPIQAPMEIHMWTGCGEPQPPSGLNTLDCVFSYEGKGHV